MGRKIVIAGGVAGGASVAAKARRVDEYAEIVLFERGPYISFANCGLPYYIKGSIKSKDALLVQTPGTFWKRFQIKACIQHEVLSIDRVKKAVEVNDLVSGRIFNEHRFSWQISWRKFYRLKNFSSQPFLNIEAPIGHFLPKNSLHNIRPLCFRKILSKIMLNIIILFL